MPVAMTRTVTVVQHVAFEDLGSFESVLRQRGLRIEVLQADVDPLTQEAVLAADLLVVLGGPISVNDTEHFPFLVEARELLAQRLRDDRPTLGICLGAQLMSVALGGSVAPMGRKEIGFGPLSLAAALPADHPLRALTGGPVLHWHGERFSVPEGATPLASTALCDDQAFSWKQHGLAELESSGIDLHALRADAERYADEVAARGRAFFDAWLTGCGL
jgi:GMP synthase (glutamine-hydrolysing)